MLKKFYGVGVLAMFCFAGSSYADSIVCTAVLLVNDQGSTNITDGTCSSRDIVLFQIGSCKLGTTTNKKWIANIARQGTDLTQATLSTSAQTYIPISQATSSCKQMCVSNAATTCTLQYGTAITVL